MIEPGADVEFSEGERVEFTDYVSNELDEALDEHGELEDRLDSWDELYTAEPKEKRKTFPWPGAANVEIPIISIACDSIAARLLNTIFGVEPFWTVNPLRREMEPFAKPVERWMDWSRKNEFDLYGECRKATNELIRHGWNWYKVCWELFTRRVWTPEGIREDVIRRPAVYHILNRDVIRQAGVEDDAQTEWVAQRFRISDNQFRLRYYNGVYKVDDVDEFLENKEDAYRVHQSLKSSDMVPQIPKEKLNTFYEIQIDWPYGPKKSSRVPTPMLATFHKPTKQFVRCIFHPYPWRNLKKVKFIEREGRAEGYGISKRLEHIQKEISTIHRQQVDNGTIANTKFFLGKRNVVRTNTPIWPGRVLGVNDPSTDLKVFDLGTPGAFAAMRALELQALMYAERASGVSDYQLGRESPVAGSRATATGTLAIIQEGNRRFDLNIRDLRYGLSAIGGMVLEVNQIFRPKGATFWVQGEEGQLTEVVLSLPPEFSASKLAVELTASTATINKATEKQELIAFMGLTERYHQAMTQMGLMLFNPQIPPPVKEYFAKAAMSSSMLMRRIAQTFDFKNVSELVPALLEEDALNVNPGGVGPGQGAPPFGGNNGASPYGRNSPMAPFLPSPEGSPGVVPGRAGTM